MVSFIPEFPEVGRPLYEMFSPFSKASSRRTNPSISKQLSIIVNSPTSALIKALSENFTSSISLLTLRESAANNPAETDAVIFSAPSKGAFPCLKEK